MRIAALLIQLLLDALTNFIGIVKRLNIYLKIEIQEKPWRSLLNANKR